MIAKFRTTTWSRVLLGSVMLGTVAFAGLAKEVKAETAPLQPITQEAPKGWYKNGNEDDMPHYVVGLDATQPHVAPVSAYVKSISSEVKQFGGMMQNFNAADYIGKRVRFSAWIKTKDVARSANLWMRIDGSKRSMKFDNMNDRAPKGTTDWAHFSVVLDVPDEATGIFMGFFVGGTGHAWFNDPKFEVVDPIVAETDMKRNIPR